MWKEVPISQLSKMGLGKPALPDGLPSDQTYEPAKPIQIVNFQDDE
jgi:hypothetical protein